MDPVVGRQVLDGPLLPISSLWW